MYTVTGKILKAILNPYYRKALVRGRVFAASEHEHVLGALGLCTIVDIGANRGQFALCARKLYPNAQIFSFEPLKKAAQVFEHVFADDPHTRLFNVAIGPRSALASMHVARWDVSSSLLPIGKLQRDNFPFATETEIAEVRMSTLLESIDAQAIKDVALLKLDVQGFELQALQGCGSLIDNFQYVYAEISFIELYVGQALATEVLEFLFAKGFKLICVANLASGKERRPIQGDFLFSRL